MAALQKDQRLRRIQLAQWREQLNLDPHAQPRTRNGQIIGFQGSREVPVPEGWRYDHDKGLLIPDQRTATGIDAAHNLRRIRSGRIGGAPGDRPWPGGMPNSIMFKGLAPGQTTGRLRWRIERPEESGFIGNRLFVRWPRPLPGEYEQRLNLSLWQMVSDDDWYIETLCSRITPRRAGQW
ncbi:hypothetical protein [Nocardiopsis synnemataformans]|uniref:hypothetical protein n=1 Tax=Nocardiopsis synnemataformans TaxID=61305 RepID=UPI003EB8A5C2